MNQEEILTKYNNSMSELEHQFPMDIDSLKQYHKSIISKILPLEPLEEEGQYLLSQIMGDAFTFHNWWHHLWHYRWHLFLSSNDCYCLMRHTGSRCQR